MPTMLRPWEFVAPKYWVRKSDTLQVEWRVARAPPRALLAMLSARCTARWDGVQAPIGLSMRDGQHGEPA